MNTRLGRIGTLVGRVAGGETTLEGGNRPCLLAPIAAALRIDIAPVALLVLSHNEVRRLQELRRPTE